MRSDLPDAALVEATAEVLASPRSAPADSFVLHAPLELLARAALLPAVEPAARDAARARIAGLAAAFEEWGPAAPAVRVRRPDDPDAALAMLRSALAAGGVDDADAAVTWLAEHLEAEELARALADPVLPLLSAAAHASIFCAQLPRVAPRSRAAALTVRGLARELARFAGWELRWFREAPAGAGAVRSPAELADRLAAPSSPGDPGSDFVYPVMSLTERSGLAAALLSGVQSLPVAEARRTLTRTAARSMLQDDAGQAPYGWSHCLTMPQATLAIAHACADPGDAVAVAATYALGFRAVHGRVALDRSWAPAPPASADAIAALDASPGEAAAAAWYAGVAERPAVRARLASRAAAHHDAHLVKYTVACFDAARSDPAAEHLYLAAAAFLGAWWAEHDAGAASVPSVATAAPAGASAGAS